MTKISVRNPSTGALLQELESTPLSSLPEIFENAKHAQKIWAQRSAKYRSRKLIDLREVILNSLDDLIQSISEENGKPKVEAMIHDLLPSVELLSYFSSKAKKLLKDRRIGMSNPLLWHRTSRLVFEPLGVVAVISPWNFPFFLPFGEIAMAAVTGNAVIFKPSEISPLIGLKIQSLFDEAGFPRHLLQTLIGDGSIGAALIEQKPNKIFFTGSVATGKKINEAAAKHMIPVVLELGGKDPMIVMPDADLDFASSAALWGGFTNSGQMCASVERLYVHERVAPEFKRLLQSKVEKLRQGNPSSENIDLGSITAEKQKEIYKSQLNEARSHGAMFLTGGEFNETETALKPTLIESQKTDQLSVYNDETFGPIIALDTFRSTEEAVNKANASEYGLTASIITKNLSVADDMAKSLESGTININEVAYTAGLSETPWLGVKNSGRGMKHSDLGILEFVQIKHIHKPIHPAFSFKSFWWFPYTSLQQNVFRNLFELYRKSWVDKLKALPLFLHHLVQMLKNDRRL